MTSVIRNSELAAKLVENHMNQSCEEFFAAHYIDTEQLRDIYRKGYEDSHDMFMQVLGVLYEPTHAHRPG